MIALWITSDKTRRSSWTGPATHTVRTEFDGACQSARLIASAGINPKRFTLQLAAVIWPSTNKSQQAAD